jgi:hypothetical protein
MLPEPMRARSIPALIVLAFVASAALALAQEPPDPGRLRAAAEDFDEGARLFKLKQFEEAAERFESADRLAPSAAPLGNAIRARRAAKQNARAATLSALALARYPEDKAIEELATKTIHELEKQLHRAEVSCRPGCTLLLDNKIAASDSVSSFSLFVEPGPHALVAGWSGGRARTAKFEAKKGVSEPISFEAPPLPAASASGPAATAAPTTTAALPPPGPSASAPGASTGGLPPWVFLVGAGATVVVGGLAIWSGVDTQSNPGPDNVRLACAGKTRDCDLFQQGLAHERRTNVLLVTTGVLGVATGVVGGLFTDWKGGGKGGGEARGPGVRSVGASIDAQRGMSFGLGGVF